MSDINFIYKRIEDIFTPLGGNGEFTKDFCILNKGEYPVYSSNNEQPFSFCNQYEYEGKFLTWAIVGCAGYITVVDGKFSITNNRGILIPTDLGKDIDVDYAKFILEPIFRKNKKGRMGYNGQNEYTTLNATAIKKINFLIPIPIKEDGTFDLEKQKEIAQKYKRLEEKKKILLRKKEKLANLLLEAEFTKEYVHSEIEIKELFNIENGNGLYTKKFCTNNLGTYPVYSGNTVQEFSRINRYDYDGVYLTWAKDGLAGYMMCLKGKFSITNHRGILIPTELCKNIDMEYIQFILEPIFRKSIKGRMGHNGQNEYTTLNKTMIESITDKISIPIKADGVFDIDAQKEIAKKYKKINEMIKNICIKIEKLLEIQVIFK